jgi:hypothetical protein
MPGGASSPALPGMPGNAARPNRPDQPGSTGSAAVDPLLADPFAPPTGQQAANPVLGPQAPIINGIPADFRDIPPALRGAFPNAPDGVAQRQPASPAGRPADRKRKKKRKADPVVGAAGDEAAWTVETPSGPVVSTALEQELDPRDGLPALRGIEAEPEQQAPEPARRAPSH